jgi:hypothetical protein
MKRRKYWRDGHVVRALQALHHNLGVDLTLCRYV